MNEQLSFNCIYTISSETQLTSFDRKIISQLYQPIIGYQAVALYFTLCSEVEVDRIYTKASKIERLSKIMNIDLKQLMDCFNLLEALGLIKSYFKSTLDESVYHFIIYSPDSPQQFFNNPLLVSNLVNSLGTSEFIKTKSIFEMKKLDLDEYQNISKKYKEVFSLNHDPRINNSDDEYRGYRYAKVESDVDFELLKQALRKYNLHALLLDENKKNYLEMLMLEYNLDINTLVDSLLTSLKDGEVDFKELEEYLKAGKRLSEKQTELERIYYKKENSDNVYDSNSVYEYLKKYQKIYKINIMDYKKLENIIKEYPLSNGVYNVLIEMVESIRKSIDLNYLRVVAQQWLQLNISSVEEAKKQVEKVTTKGTKKNRNYRNKEVIGNVNNWYQGNNDVEVDEQELEEIEKWLKNR